MATAPEMYFSFDIEADGGYPSEYSMLSIGMVRCATNDGTTFTRLSLDEPSNHFYSTIKPITENFVPAAVEICKVGGVDRDELLISGLHPKTVMPRLRDFVRIGTMEYRPIAVCYPAWDWNWLYDYLERFSPDNPFGFSGMIDIKSFYAGRRKAMIINSVKRNMPDVVKSKRPHTHNALDDALEQADIFCNIWERL